MNAATVANFPRLPAPDGRASVAPPNRGTPTAAAGGLRAHVWLAADSLFRRESAQQFCWLWLLGMDGRVHALRVAVGRMGDDRYAESLLAWFATGRDLPIPADHALGAALPLPAAPIVPLPRWHLSWGHPVQLALRAFAEQLDAGVLEALGALEVRGSFFGSVANYNRLALLPDAVRRHRIQALAEFPPLVAPLLLDAYGRPDMFGNDEDEPAETAIWRIPAIEKAGGLAALRALGKPTLALRDAKTRLFSA